jgi:flagellin
MPDGVSAALRANLTALQKIAREKIARDVGRAQNRLAAGQQVNSPSDNPAAYVTASSLTARAAALNSVLDSISNGGNMRSLADRVQSSPSTPAKISGSVTGLTVATVVSLDNGETVTVSDGNTTAVYSHAIGQDVQDLINAVNTTANLDVKARLTGDDRIQLDATGVNSVIIGGSVSVGELSTIGLSAGTTTSTSTSLLAGSTLVIGLSDTGGAERLVESDIDEEVASLLALQTRRDLASTSLSLAAESDEAMLRLFGSS